MSWQDRPLHLYEVDSPDRNDLGVCCGLDRVTDELLLIVAHPMKNYVTYSKPEPIWNRYEVLLVGTLYLFCWGLAIGLRFH